ncbi:MAG: type II toxin-antitoxin system VapC family toxin [Candidatus Omnitrophica bacterium]|nr:type II toxin-antitoxin system VapC family toxin [Candidatus Omnitrophota bacterium]
MKAFIDSSALVKKYIHEQGSQDLDALLENVTDIVISPTFWLELTSALQRRTADKSITATQAAWLKKQCQHDLIYFHKVIWNSLLEETAAKLILKYRLKTLDSLQLASAAVARADIFVTSDKQLFQAAHKELRPARLI